MQTEQTVSTRSLSQRLSEALGTPIREPHIRFWVDQGELPRVSNPGVRLQRQFPAEKVDLLIARLRLREVPLPRGITYPGIIPALGLPAAVSIDPTPIKPNGAGEEDLEAAEALVAEEAHKVGKKTFQIVGDPGSAMDAFAAFCAVQSGELHLTVTY